MDPSVPFNEWVMVRLLETDYIEELIKRDAIRAGKKGLSADEADYALTGLYFTVLSPGRRDNLELTEAVCNKIVRRALQRQVLSSASSLQPLAKDMVMSGNLLQKTYGMRILKALLSMEEDAARSLAADIVPVQLAMSAIRDSKCTQLLIASLEYVRTAYKGLSAVKADAGTAVNPGAQLFNPLWDSGFLDILADLLEPRAASSRRYHSRILAEVAMLVLLVSADKSGSNAGRGSGARPVNYAEPRPYLLKHRVVGALMKIVTESLLEPPEVCSVEYSIPS